MATGPMATESRPAFPFYVRDWRSSLKVQKMTFDERGRFLELLIEQWEHGAAPSSPGACAALIGGTEASWQRAWAALAQHFVPRKRDGLFVNRKLEGIRRKQQEYQKAQAVSGLKGARARWKKHGKPMDSPSKANATPMANRMAKDSLALASASSSAIATASALALASSPSASDSKDADQFIDTFKAMFVEHRGQPYRERTHDREKVITLLA